MAGRLDCAPRGVQIGVHDFRDFDPAALADAMAPLLGLTLTPESRAQTILHLRDRRAAGGEASFRSAR